MTTPLAAGGRWRPPQVSSYSPASTARRRDSRHRHRGQWCSAPAGVAMRCVAPARLGGWVVRSLAQERGCALPSVHVWGCSSVRPIPASTGGPGYSGQRPCRLPCRARALPTPSAASGSSSRCGRRRPADSHGGRRAETTQAGLAPPNYYYRWLGRPPGACAAGVSGSGGGLSLSPERPHATCASESPPIIIAR